MGNPVVHFEIVGGQGGELQGFYANLFGWAIDAANPMDYGVVAPDEAGIGGGIAASPDGSGWVTVYVAVDDLQAVLDRAQELGGHVLMPPTSVPGGPTIAQFLDPVGNRVGLVAAM